jgi:hypothetical protein
MERDALPRWHISSGIDFMETKRFNNALLLISASSLLFAGCVVRERVAYRNPPVYTDQVAVSGEVDVTGAPPAPYDETITVAPAPGMIWIGGAWAWGGGRWGWEAGHWARPPHPGAVWVPHRYIGDRHVWVRGGWR